MTENNILIKLATQLDELSVTLKTLAGISVDAAEDDIQVEDLPTNESKFEETVTLEEVRGVLAQKSHDGKREEVKTLLSQFGADRLSEIDPSKYAELKSAAEVI